MGLRLRVTMSARSCMRIAYPLPYLNLYTFKLNNVIWCEEVRDRSALAAVSSGLYSLTSSASLKLTFDLLGLCVPTPRILSQISPARRHKVCLSQESRRGSNTIEIDGERSAWAGSGRP